MTFLTIFFEHGTQLIWMHHFRRKKEYNYNLSKPLADEKLMFYPWTKQLYVTHFPKYTLSTHRFHFFLSVKFGWGWGWVGGGGHSILFILTWRSKNFYFYTITEVHFSRFPKPPYSTFPICHHLLLFSMYFLCDHISMWKITNIQMIVCWYIWGLGIIKVNCQNVLNTSNFVGSCM